MNKLHLEEGPKGAVGKWSWLCWSVDAWCRMVVSYIIVGFASLMFSMSIAFSPLTASAVLTCDDSSSLDVVSYWAQFFTIDWSFLPFLSYHHVASDASNNISLATDKTFADCNQGVSSLMISTSDTFSPMTTPTFVTVDDSSCSDIMHSRTKDRSFDDKILSSSAYHNSDTNDLSYFTMDHTFAESNYNISHRLQKRKRDTPPVSASQVDVIDDDSTRHDYGNNVEKHIFDDESRPKTSKRRRPTNTYSDDESSKTNATAIKKQRKLKSMQFSQVSKQQMQTWMEFYRSLIVYKKEHNGSTAVPRRYSENRRLGAWVYRQRRRYRQGKLSTAQIDLLKWIGFSWDPQVRRNNKITSR